MNLTPDRRTVLTAAALATAGPAFTTTASARRGQTMGEWPYARADPANTGHNPSITGPEGNIDVETILEAEGLSETVLAVDGTAYLGRGDVIAAHSLADGTEQWTWDAAEIPTGGNPVGHSGQLLYAKVGGVESAIGFLDPGTGTRQWLVRGQGNVTVTPTSEEIYISQGSVLSSLEQSGADRWQQSFEREIRGTAVAGERVFVATGQAVAALRREDGTAEWQHSVQAFDEPVISDGSVYVIGETVTALAETDGTERWRASDLPSPLTAPVAATPGRVYVGASETNETFFALDSETGAVEWGVRLGSTAVPGSAPATTRPAVAGNAVYVGSSQTVHGINPDSGEILWRSTQDSAVGSPVPIGGRLLVPVEDRLLAMSEGESAQTDDDQQSGNGSDQQSSGADSGTDSETGDGVSEDDTSESADGSDDGSSDGSGPGFGLPAGLAALGGLGYLLRDSESEE